MIRLLLLASIGGLIYWFWKWTMARFERLKNLNQQATTPNPIDGGKTSELVQDPVCKLFISKDKAIYSDGHYFCTEKCKNEYKKT